MPKDDEIGAMILGGIIGAILAAPKPEEKQELQQYRNLKTQISLRQQRVGVLPSLSKIMSKPMIHSLFTEAYRTYLFGFFRSSVILSSALLELLLKEKFGDKRFFELIELAKKEALINEIEYHFLHGVRLQRNDAIHNFEKEIREEDALIALRIAIDAINKLVW
ncbi:MAG: hypothetical protein C0177_07280 [Fervidicoccus fontis]|nr:MAG: hypothetical protein C0177_07280 [Fervidicoccus fontis]